MTGFDETVEPSQYWANRLFFGKKLLTSAYIAGYDGTEIGRYHYARG